MVCTKTINYNNWTSATKVFSGLWYSLAYGNGIFAVLDSQGYASTSTDGLNWTAKTSTNLDAAGEYYDAIFAENKFITIGQYGGQFIVVGASNDGIDWSDITGAQISNNRYPTNLVFNGTKYLLIDTNHGYIANINYPLKSSSAISSFYSVSSISGSFSQFIYDGAKVMAIKNNGNVYVSTDTAGNNWTIYSNTNLGSKNWKGLNYNGLKYIVLSSDGYTSTSDDGITWTTPTQNTNLGSNSWYKLANNVNSFVSMSSSGYFSLNKIEEIKKYKLNRKINNAVKKYILTIKTNNTNPTWAVSAVNGDLVSLSFGNVKSLLYNGEYYLAVSLEGGIAKSYDGKTWTAGTNLSSGSNYSSAVYDGTNFIVLRYDGYIFKSSNGTNWSYSHPLSSSSSYYWQAIAYGGGKYIAVSDNEYYIGLSSDGTNWTETVQTTMSKTIISLIYADTEFIGITTSGYIVKTSDGLNWTTSSSAILGSNNWSSLVYDGMKIIALGKTGYISISLDKGNTWTTPTQNTNLGSRNWGKMAYSSKDNKILALSTSDYISSCEPLLIKKYI